MELKQQGQNKKQFKDLSDLPNHVDSLVTSVKTDVCSVWFRIRVEQNRYLKQLHFVFGLFNFSTFNGSHNQCKN